MSISAQNRASLAYNERTAGFRQINQPGTEEKDRLNKKEEFGFFDLLDMVNPLQHIPLVGNLYREMTGDSIKPISTIIGGALFGGPLGAASGIVNVIVAEETGKDIVGNVIDVVHQDNT